jgi:hypothetical protein
MNESEIIIHEKIVNEIIIAQESIIGPIARERAAKVDGISFTDKNIVVLTGDPHTIINTLVEQYKLLFGEISVQVCRDAALRFSSGLTSDQLPKSLQ